MLHIISSSIHHMSDVHKNLNESDDDFEVSTDFELTQSAILSQKLPDNIAKKQVTAKIELDEFAELEKQLEDLDSPNVELRFVPDELVFSRRHTKGKNKYSAKLNRNEVATATKFGAKKLGLNEKCFATHSWRIGSISELIAQGEGDETVRRLGDHAANSSSTFLYQRESGREVRPLMLASNGKGLTVRDSQLRCSVL